MFIVFEGIDGSGKTTQAKLLKQNLEKEGYKVKFYSEPHFLGIKKLTSLIKNELVKTILFTLSRYFLVQKILKDLNKNYIVILDRYFYSTLAYQGYAGGVDIKLIEKLNKWSTKGLQPDVVFLIDVPIEIAISRLLKKGEGYQVLEKRKYLEKVKRGYLKLVNRNSNFYLLNEIKDFYVLDGTKNIEELQKIIMNTIKEKLNTRKLIVLENVL